MTSTWKGRWQIVETDLWSDDSLDLLEPAHIELGGDRIGRMVIGALQADLDYRLGKRDGKPTVEFTWEGDDDGSPTCGRGAAQIEADGRLRVELFIHHGDAVVMTGVRNDPSPRSRTPARAPARRGARRSPR